MAYPQIKVPAGIENPGAYVRAAHRRIDAKIAAKRAAEAPVKASAWLAADPSRVDLINALEAQANSGNGFAQSLLRGYNQYGSLSEKQEAAARNGMKSKEERHAQREVVVSDEELRAVIALFQNVSDKLKRPAIVFSHGQSPTLRISQAGVQSNAPGALNVKLHDGTYVGRVHLDGRWAPSREFSDPHILPALKAFAADPAGIAAEYGHRTGQCCFCSHPLTTVDSLKVGYGPRCAENYQLPWGKQ